MKIYCFSGLGADERAFKYLDLHPYELVHVKWLDPLERETLESYAKRMGATVNQNEPFILMGLSFGGMLVQELSMYMHPRKTILISTISGKHEQPFRMKISKLFNLYNLIPSKYFNRPSSIAFRLFGAKSEGERELLSEILQDSDPKYIRWALNAIAGWNNTQTVEAFRIHGSDDQLFPLSSVKPDYVVAGGGHLMVVSHAKEIEQQLLNVIDPVN